MYSHEIDKVLNENNYDIGANTYLHICRTSPQLNHIKYDAYSNKFQMWSNDGYHWEFVVHREDLE